jgi:hypothetical protein
MKVINITNFELKNLELDISFSGNVEVLPLDTGKKVEIASLSTKETFCWNVTTRIKKFSVWVCHIDVKSVIY